MWFVIQSTPRMINNSANFINKTREGKTKIKLKFFMKTCPSSSSFYHFVNIYSWLCFVFSICQGVLTAVFTERRNHVDNVQSRRTLRPLGLREALTSVPPMFVVKYWCMWSFHCPLRGRTTQNKVIFLSSRWGISSWASVLLVTHWGFNCRRQ